MDELWRLSACELVELLRKGAVSPTEAVMASIRRIEATDGRINALPIRCFERALKAARRLETQKKAEGRGSLAGLPVAIKDVIDVAGVRATCGSAIFADRVPETSDILVERLEQRGAIVVAKANTPAFASSGGLNTANELFGATLNPWNTAWACGGSSGGSAAAVAAGQVWLAAGTDLGGSLRQPASFCGVVGLRPTPGVVPRGPAPLPHDALCVAGPMARTVADVALMLDAWAGDHPFDPIALPAPDTAYSQQACTGTGTLRVAYSATLGLVPVEREVASLCAHAVRRLEALGATVDEKHPDLRDAGDILATLRPAWLASHWGHLLGAHRNALAPDFRARLEAGMRLSAATVWEAERNRAQLAARMIGFLAAYDVLVCPTVPIAPFAAQAQRVPEVDGLVRERESDWMLLTYAVSLTGCPALSLPCGYTAEGRPVGVQLVAAPRRDGMLLAIAAMLERALDLSPRVPVEL